uniref:Wsv447-like protein n=1 Tax=Sicyonia whispovirus TaxID=2984283 RepID=A0A9C7CED9_9VIRU|nr:MAG: wsv447-like protein [Sicyonia whispovirus]
MSEFASGTTCKARLGSCAGSKRAATRTSVACVYPFRTTRSHVWRKAAGQLTDRPAPERMVLLPGDPASAREILPLNSAQQALASRYLRNSLALSYSGAGVGVFHLGGLPGAGKTAIIKELIADLDDNNLIDSKSDTLMLCSKSNAALANLMSACETSLLGKLLYPASSFCTLNKGFAIPVIHNRDEIDKKFEDYAALLKKKFDRTNLSVLRLLVIDEYTMTNCREVVYIDAVLRLLKMRPDLPFGGVFVLFLGDNRQNSAVIEDGGRGVCAARPRGATQEPGPIGKGAEDTPATGAEQETVLQPAEDYLPENSKLYTEMLLKMLAEFVRPSVFCSASFVRKVLQGQLKVVRSNLSRACAANENLLRAGRPNGPAKSNSSEQRQQNRKQKQRQPTSVPAESPTANLADSLCGFDWGDEEDFLAMLADEGGDENRRPFLPESAPQPTGCGAAARPFAMRAAEAIAANDRVRNRCGGRLDSSVADVIEGGEEPSAHKLGRAPLSVLVEEGLAGEAEHLEWLIGLSDQALVAAAMAVAESVLATARKAMAEIDYTGREKLFIVSGLAEGHPSANAVVMADEEVLLAKMTEGNDPRCSDLVPFETARSRHKALGAAVRNAFFREGVDTAGRVPAADFFANNLRRIGELLRPDDFSFQQLEEASLAISQALDRGDARLSDSEFRSMFEPACSRVIGAETRHPGSGVDVENGSENDNLAEGEDENSNDNRARGEGAGHSWNSNRNPNQIQSHNHNHNHSDNENENEIVDDKDDDNDDEDQGDYEGADGDEDSFFDDWDPLCGEDDGRECYGMPKFHSRDDIPSGLTAYSSISDRVKKMVDFHLKWKLWLEQSRPRSVTRARVWFLYIMVRMREFSFDDGRLPSLERCSSTGRLFFSSSEWLCTVGGRGRAHEEEYWLRALSMPVCSEGDGDASLVLPAYSSYLSAISRTYVMSSLKRVNVLKHAYAMMYGVSLLDMTVDVGELVDHRASPAMNNSRPMGCQRNVCAEEYFGGIFPELVGQFFFQSFREITDSAFKAEQLFQGDYAQPKCQNIRGVLSMAQLLNQNYGSGVKHSRSAPIALRMLTSIFSGNARFENVKRIMAAVGGGEGDGEGSGTGASEDADSGPLPAKRAASFFSVIEQKLRESEQSERREASLAALERKLGAVTLARSHALKNAVSSLVDMYIIGIANTGAPAESEGRFGSATKTGVGDGDGAPSPSRNAANSIKSVSVDTKFFVAGVDLSYLAPGKIIRHCDLRKIVETLRENKTVFDTYTDRLLLKQEKNNRSFSSTLLKLRNKVTKTKTVNLYTGQTVVFTETNTDHKHGTAFKYITKDTGVVTNLSIRNGNLEVAVLVSRLSDRALNITMGEQHLRNDRHGFYDKTALNTLVRYVPIESSQAMTIYSCQGKTFTMDTVVDLGGVTQQDAYVAITRNSDPINLYMVGASASERKQLCNLKCSMAKDKTRLMPLGGLGDLGGDCFVDWDSVSVAEQVLQNSVDSPDQLRYASFDPRSDLVTAVQRFVMDRTGNVFAFNSAWMARTAEMIRAPGYKGVEGELRRIGEHFFGCGPEAEERARFYAQASQRKFLELFTAVSRSVTHYMVQTGAFASCGRHNIEEYIAKHHGRSDYVKVDPCAVNGAPESDFVDTFFYDVAPHSKTLSIFQFYAHYLFLVYEMLHVCNAAFAFLCAPNPQVNANVRPVIAASFPAVELSLARLCARKDLSFESPDFARASDGGARDEILRDPVFVADRLSGDIEKIRSEYLSPGHHTEEAVEGCVDLIRKSMLHNLRRPGKFCRPQEACGLDGRGAVVVATLSGGAADSHVHVDEERGWVSTAGEANLYGMLVFMTKLAAASGVTVSAVANLGRVFAPAEDMSPAGDLEFALSKDIIFSGQASPFFRVQMALHVRRVAPKRRGGPSRPRRVFNPTFFDLVKKMGVVSGIKVVALTEMLGHKFASASTVDIRNTLFFGAGRCIATYLSALQPAGENGSADSMNQQIEKMEHFLKNTVTSELFTRKGKRISFFISIAV